MGIRILLYHSPMFADFALIVAQASEQLDAAFHM